MNINKAKLLIVEDDLIVAKAVLTKFKAQDIDADLAIDGEEALKKLETNGYKVVLLDLLLPHKDGFWLLNQLSKDQKFAHLKVMIFSNLNKQDAPALKNFAIVDYIVKAEISLDDIANRVTKFLD